MQIMVVLGDLFHIIKTYFVLLSIDFRKGISDQQQ